MNLPKNYSVPLAERINERVNGKYLTFAICPVCSITIRLSSMKDNESYSAREYAEHYYLEHEKNKD